MKLDQLIRSAGHCEISGSVDIDVKDIAYNASAVKAGACFVALRGLKSDGHSFVDEAVSRGAVAVVSERPVNLPPRVTGVIVKDSRRAMSVMSAAFFGEPSRSMKVVGVTGTNGKTTFTYLMESIFAASGEKTGVIGTVEYRFGGVREKAPHTTPESYELQKLLGRMRDAKVSACAMEVSSHALAQERVAGCHFDAAVFTNLTPEHLDYHNDMESYFEAKAILFEKLLSESEKTSRFAAVNVDDAYGKKIAKRCPVPVVTCGLDAPADVTAAGLAFDAKGLKMRVKTPLGSFECKSHLCGRFNALNILSAVSTAIKLNIGIDTIASAIENVSVVPGRFEPVGNDRGILALVDYAHTPDAIVNALKNARALLNSKGGRVIVVFGCGGDRDRLKRPLMGRQAALLADVVIVTSDNPRSEDPDAIISEIAGGMKELAVHWNGERGYQVISDRRSAIARAVEISRAGDVLIVAGKGHEDYQIIGDKRIHFDDREVLKEEFLKHEGRGTKKPTTEDR